MAEGLAARDHSVELLTAAAAPDGAPSGGAVAVHRFRSDAQLAGFLASRGKEYDAVLLAGYGPAVAAANVPAIRERAWLVPSLRLGPAARSAATEELFHGVRGVLFREEEEFALAVHLYGPGIVHKSDVIGAWLATAAAAPVAEFEADRERYIVCVGRRSEVHSTGFLVEAFRRYQDKHPGATLRLVLAGPGTTTYGDEAHRIVDLGDLPEAQRNFLMQRSLAVLAPNYAESFPDAVLQGWAGARPVVVSENSRVAARIVHDVGGGLVAAGKDQWADAFGYLDAVDASVLGEMGSAGYAYYRRNGALESALERIERVLFAPREPAGGERFHQLLPSRDACDDAVRRGWSLRDWLGAAGNRVTSEVGAIPVAESLPPEATLLVHSYGEEALVLAARTAARRVLFYAADEFGGSEYEVRLLVPTLQAAYVETGPDADLLRDAGASRVEVIPFAMSMECWDISPDATLVARLSDGKANCLFAGWGSIEMQCDQLVAAFAYLLALGVDARLVLAVSGEPADPDCARLTALVEERQLTDRVVFVDPCDPRALAAAYRTARVFLSMSESSRSRTPFLDAMWFGVPVLAFAGTAARETLGSAGLLFNTKDNFLHIAMLTKFVLHDAALRAKLLESQERRRRDLTPDVEAALRPFASLVRRSDVVR